MMRLHQGVLLNMFGLFEPCEIVLTHETGMYHRRLAHLL